MVSTILKGAAAWLFIFDRSFFRAMTAPFVLFLLAEVVGHLMASVTDPVSGLGTLVFFFNLMLMLAGSTLVAIVVHRTVLLGRVDDFGFGFFWSKRESWFALYLVGLVPILLLAVFLAFIPVVGPFLMFPAMGYLMARLSLVFPAIATNRAMSFRMSWRLTRRYQLQVFIILALVPWLFYLPLYLLPENPYLLVFQLFLDFAITIYLTTTLSLLYRQIVGMELSAANSNEG